MSGNANTILISSGSNLELTVKEELGTGVITPGHLLARNSTGVVVHGVAQGADNTLFALENLPGEVTPFGNSLSLIL